MGRKHDCSVWTHQPNLLWRKALYAHVPANTQDDASHDDVCLNAFHHQLVHVAHVFANLNGAFIPYVEVNATLPEQQS